MKLLLALLLVLFGCSAPSFEANPQVAQEPEWEGLMVTWNDRSVVVDTLRDSLSLLVSDSNATDPSMTKSRSVFVGKDARDSIWLIARHLMDTPTIRDMEVTDYAGDYMRVRFYGAGVGTMQTLEYRSQNGWPVGGDLGQLRRLTFDRFPEE